MLTHHVIIFHVLPAKQRHALRMEVTTTTERDMIFLQQRRIACTLFLVFAAFLLCWMPQKIYAVYTSFTKSEAQDALHIVNPIVSILFSLLRCAMSDTCHR